MGDSIVPAPLCMHSGHHQQDWLMLFEKRQLVGGGINLIINNRK